MKKTLSLFLSALLLAALLMGCGTAQAPVETTAAPTETAETTVETTAATEATEAAEAVDVRVAALKGPTAMGLAQFIHDAAATTDNNYQFTVAVNPDEIVPQLIKGEVDMAAIPANLASVVYNKTEGGIQVLGINTLGVLYVVESGDTVHTMADLKGKTLFATGKNHTPEQALTYLLEQNGMKLGQDVTVEWKSEPAECLAALENAENGIAMLPQPFVTVAMTKNENLRVALDLTAEWNAVQAEAENPSAMVTGVVVARKAFVEEHPQAVSAFMDHYAASVDFVNTNVEEAAAYIEEIGVVKAPIAKKAIPACNIVFLEGAEMQGRLSGYLEVLFNQNPQSVGGALPESDFYFAR